LAGAHTWNNLVDIGHSDPPRRLDFARHLDWLRSYNHNFTRLWAIDLTQYQSNPDASMSYVSPSPWRRTGPGTARDGKPKFDLSQLNDAYFDRLRSRVEAAGRRGIYVSIMLFEGWGMRLSEPPWRCDAHPFNAANNVNGINVDRNRDGLCTEAHTLADRDITAIQEDYVARVIETVNDLDNVIYEIANEARAGSAEWQYYLIDFIHDYEDAMPKQHPVGMTTCRILGNDAVFSSPAEWISPSRTRSDDSEPYRSNPPATDGSYVILLDTDHIWGIGGDHVWVWKSFLRGYNPIYMDNLRDVDEQEDARRALGHTVTYAQRLDLGATTPLNGLSSTRYCLAEPGRAYLVYQPRPGASFTVEVEAGFYDFEWFDPESGTVVDRGTLDTAGGSEPFRPPSGVDAVLFLERR
jgi:hypothetical protein